MKYTTYRVTMTALFLALIVLLGMTPLGLIPLGFINVTVLCVPVIIGTLLMGLGTGMLLGACFALVSILCMFGMSPMVPPSQLGSTLAAANPLLAIAMCLVPRLMVPVLTHFVYVLAAHGQAERARAIPFAAVAGSLTNTVFYLGLMLLFYTVVGLDSTLLMSVIAGTGLIAGGCEAAVAAIIATPVMVALWKTQTKLGR